jgi:SagB-type dehydrogenase family enzyme
MSKVIEPNIAFGPREKTHSISLAELYHENTKFHPLTTPEPGKTPSESYSTSEIRAMSRAYKQYPSAHRIRLPKVESLPASKLSFDDVISSRRSLRNFSNAELNLNDLSKMLFQSYGITGEMTLSGGITQYLRAAPSAGALYPAELYLGIRRVTEVEPGVYHYNVLNHELELLIPDDPTEDLYQICGQQEYARQASVVILISGVIQRTKRKYGDRGYRYVLLDVGHLGQNIYLACSAQGLSVMTTCGFFDDEANKLLRLDGVDETMLYVAFVGK